MEEMNSNSILYYCSVCECILTFQLSNIDKRNIQSIKKHIVNSDFITSKYILERDIQSIDNLILQTRRQELIYLLNELKCFLEDYMIFDFFN